jgi:hypothetical protein
VIVANLNLAVEWQHVQQFKPHRFRCGHCDRDVASDRGFSSSEGAKRIIMCPSCARPTLFADDEVFPLPRPAEGVEYLPTDVAGLYEEARSAAGRAPTAAVLALRKLLMHVAVDVGAKPNQNFVAYVDYLADHHHIPPSARNWVDHIRRKGNEANHDIVLVTPPDAEELLQFSEMLLKIVYEFPKRLAARTP